MKTVTLQKNLEMNGVLYETGTTLDVPDDVYDYLITSLVADRVAMIEENKKFEEEIAKVTKKKVTK